ncbi:hypothetical protein LTR56_001703 [Elasticomyces elasticus]|nr:hypothetical protein LTR56_001703 [Elasticomyces elasticus]KAK3667246.1 hypothetical protein LTR22_001762 [Elasticomyces elasticus]KAK4932676.1 hypothetical protein LTR49_001100 [Elasticomyces elasticus]KAK5769697.1 hypothetical protein LTS12_000147 [Elasticomyces elasticus]
MLQTTPIGSFANATATNTTLPAVCQLSPHARALSTVLTALVGSIVGGISGGWFTAFFMAWVCWLASLRICVVGIWALFEALSGHSLEGGSQFQKFYAHVPGLHKIANGWKESDDPCLREDADTNKPTLLGWLGWLWPAIYSPIVQTMWLVENWHHPSGSLKIVRAIGVSVTALPLTMDTRARYGAALGDTLGKWADRLFNLITATSCLALGVIACIELVVGAIEASSMAHFAVVYVLLMLLWTYVSFTQAIPHDKARSVYSLRTFVAGLAMGAFGGFFTASPAFTVMSGAQDTPGVGLGD